MLGVGVCGRGALELGMRRLAHVPKPGARFQALEPISMALADIYGGVDQGP